MDSKHKIGNIVFLHGEIFKVVKWEETILWLSPLDNKSSEYCGYSEKIGGYPFPRRLKSYSDSKLTRKLYELL